MPPRIHRREGRAGLGHHSRMPAEGWHRHPGSEVADRGLPEGAEHIPDEACLALAGHPGLKTVGGHHPGETVRLCVGAESDHLGRRELFEHRGKSDVDWAGRGSVDDGSG